CSSDLKTPLPVPLCAMAKPGALGYGARRSNSKASNAMTEARETTHFGEQTVAMDDKQGMVNAVFHNVADRYDLMNDLMSGGVHRLWKSAMVAELAPTKTGTRPYRVLDIAGGTGAIAERIIDA